MPAISHICEQCGERFDAWAYKRRRFCSTGCAAVRLRTGFNKVQYSAAYYQQHRDDLGARARARYWSNRERGIAYAKAWKEQHPDRVREYKRRRRADELSVGGERIRISKLPAELQPVAQLIKDSRSQIRRRRGN